MNAVVSFTVPGTPTAFARAGARGRRRYTPPAQASYARAVGTVASTAMRGAPVDGPLRVEVTAFYLAPASWSRARRDRTLYKTSTPDADNLGKLVLDAAKGIVWHDDAQVAELLIRKVYSGRAELVVSVARLAASPANIADLHNRRVACPTSP